ncbi:MAG: hypothetical protein C5B43_04710 [Verrucomicrobia bacterium]|nr:MAG: hypothetical protein C5B43_04710 [Verrucomicrobiota bacterium]
MIPETSNSNFLVDIYSDPICLKIKGRANYLNCAPLNDFFNALIQKNNITVTIDLQECTGMDSTVLGLLAGIALEFKKQNKKNTLYLINVNNRNLESIENLGLNLILKVNPPEYSSPSTSSNQLQSLGFQTTSTPETILRAHQNLIQAQPSNLYKFQDVITFLKKQTQDN